MSDVAPPHRQKWGLTQEAFDHLLAALGDDRDRAAERYERARTKLVKFFAWERCDDPEDRADETMNRVARRLSEGEQIGNPEGYLYGVARLLLREAIVEGRRKSKVMEELSHGAATSAEPADDTALECLESCLRKMPADQRAFILEYYQGEQRTRIETRRRIALRLQLPVNAVRNRALRLREKMEDCVRECMGRKKAT